MAGTEHRNEQIGDWRLAWRLGHGRGHRPPSTWDRCDGLIPSALLPNGRRSWPVLSSPSVPDQAAGCEAIAAVKRRNRESRKKSTNVPPLRARSRWSRSTCFCRREAVWERAVKRGISTQPTPSHLMHERRMQTAHPTARPAVHDPWHHGWLTGRKPGTWRNGRIHGLMACLEPNQERRKGRRARRVR